MEPLPTRMAGARSLGWALLAAAVLATPLAAVGEVAKADAAPRGPLVDQDAEPCRHAAAAAAALEERAPASCTVLYAHADAVDAEWPLTTQTPSALCPDLRRGRSALPSAAPLLDWSRIVLYPTPGVTAQAARDGEPCRLVQQPGRSLAGEVRLDPRVPLTLTWYMSADADEAGAVADPPSPDAGALPCLEVRASLQASRDGGRGVTLAYGAARRTVVSADVTEPVALPLLDPCAQGDLVRAHHPYLEVASAHAFPVSLGAVSVPLPPGSTFELRVEWSQVNDGAQATAREWNVRTGPDFRNRVVLPVLDPLLVEGVEATPWARHFLRLNATVASPWGAYDVDANAIRLDILDERGQAVPSTSVSGPRLDGAGSVGDPARVSWAWDFLKARANPGPYVARLTANNLQGGAPVTVETTMDVPALLARPAPGAPALLVLAALGLAAASLRGPRPGA